MTLDPRPICEALNNEGVRYVIVGGFAAVIHGSPLPANDVDIVPARDHDNLERLSRALNKIEAKLRTTGEPVETTLDAAFLAAMPLMVNVSTRYGDLNVTFTPAGPRVGYLEWNAGTSDVDIADNHTVRIASLDDVISLKRAASRDEDTRALPYLESLRDELENQ